MNRWTSVSVRRAVLEKVSDYIASGQDETITSPSHFIDLAIREKLKEVGK